MIVKRDFIYTPKGKNRPLHIYLPEGYGKTEKRYPVMYFFDGHNLFFDADATYGKCWGLKEFLDKWDRKLILVGMECGHEGNERISEYLPYTANKTSWFGKFQPMGEATMRWVVEEVKPYIDREYRTLPGRETTGIGGSSMGGLMAIYGGVHYNAFFSKAACVSSAIGFCMRPLMADMKQNPHLPDTRMFLSWGTREAYGIVDPEKEDRASKTYGWNKKVADKAEAAGAAVRMYCQIEGRHCEADWEKQVPLFMDYLWEE